MKSMFKGDTNLELVNFGDSPDTKFLTNMQEMFSMCSSLKSIDLNKFNTINVLYMDYMFSNCDKLVDLKISNINTNKLQSASYMFNNCISLVNLDIKNFQFINAQIISGMFYNCKSLKNLQISDFSSSQSISQIDNLFNGCANLTSLDLSKLFTLFVSNFSGIFNGCTSLSELKINFNTESASTMENLFANCLSLKSLDITSFNTQNCQIFDNIFLNDENLTLYYKAKNCPNLEIPKYVNAHDVDSI
jgi:surface protein